MDYGILLILILVCICLSWATIRQGDIVGGVDGGIQLAQEAAKSLPNGVFIIIAPPDTDEADKFPDISAIKETLQKQNATVAATMPYTRLLPKFKREFKTLYQAHPTVNGILLLDPSQERHLNAVLRSLEVSAPPKVTLPVYGKESVFLKTDNLVNIVRQASVIAIIAAGMTMVIITGGIDLSVGSLVAFAGVLTALCLRQAGGIPVLWLIALIIFCLSFAGLGAGMVFGGRVRWLVIGLAVSLGISFGVSRIAQNRLLGISPDVKGTVQNLISATKEEGGVFLFFDMNKPGMDSFIEEIKTELENYPGVTVLGEQAISKDKEDDGSQSIEERAKESAQEVLATHPDLRALFGADRDILSGLNRAIDAEGATERVLAIKAVTHKTGLVVFAVAVGILVGCVGGAMSGIVITGFSIPPFIATLAMMLIARGMSRYFCNGVPVWDLPEEFGVLGNGYLFEGTIGPILPVPVAVMIFVFAIGHITLSHTRFGRYLYAVGGNEEATRLSGIPINGVKFAAYVITGGLSAVAGIIMAARLQCGHPETGALYELYVIAACVVGGASLMGGQGKILGSLIGALLIWVIFNGLNLLYVDSYLQQAILGLVIFIAVLLDQAKKRL